MYEENKVPNTKLGVYLWIKSIPHKEVYEPLGMTAPYFSQLIWGRRKEAQAFQKIADFLQVDIEDIYEGVPKKGRPRKE